MHESQGIARSLELETAAPASAVQPLQPVQSETEALRSGACAADAQGAPADAAALWNELVSGNLLVLDFFFTPQRWLVVVREAAQGQVRAVSDRSRSLLEPLLLGKSQKHTALDRGVSPSTLSMQAHRALANIGLALTPRNAPAILALLARAARGLETPPTRARRFTHSSRNLLVASVERPELQFARRLPSAEYSVLCGIVEGASYSEMARLRGTSPRTVANQVASLFHRLGVSGRSELVSFLVTRQAHGWMTSPRD